MRDCGGAAEAETSEASEGARSDAVHDADVLEARCMRAHPECAEARNSVVRDTSAQHGRSIARACTQRGRRGRGTARYRGAQWYSSPPPRRCPRMSVSDVRIRIVRGVVDVRPLGRHALQHATCRPRRKLREGPQARKAAHAERPTMRSHRNNQKRRHTEDTDM
jgi:hypothetical protein